MRLLSSLLILLVPTLVFGEIEALVDGVPKFKVHQGSAPSSVPPPTAFELALVGSPLKYTNFSELMLLLNSKNMVDDKILDLSPATAKNEAAKVQALQDENNKR